MFYIDTSTCLITVLDEIQKPTHLRGIMRLCLWNHAKTRFALGIGRSKPCLDSRNGRKIRNTYLFNLQEKIKLRKELS